MFSYNYKLALFLIIVCSVTVTHAAPYPTELTTYQVTNTAGRDPNVPIARQIHNADYGASNGPPPSPDSPPPAQAQPAPPPPPPAQNAAAAPTPADGAAAKSKRAMRFGPGPVVYHPEPSPSSDPSSGGERKASGKRGRKHAS